MEMELQNNSSSDREENKEADSAALNRRRNHYKILKEETIKQLQENDITTVSSALSLYRGLACTLLCRNKWNLTSVYAERISEEDEREREQPVGKQDLL
ncbi:hypothetical protein ACS0TY_009493 [Phlomoides rotata]